MPGSGYGGFTQPVTHLNVCSFFILADDDRGVHARAQERPPQHRPHLPPVGGAEKEAARHRRGGYDDEVDGGRGGTLSHAEPIF